MTISPEARRAAQRRLLVALLAELNHGPEIKDWLPLWSISFSADKHADFTANTWLELRNAGHIEADPRRKSGAYRFTPTGWIEALKCAGELTRSGRAKSTETREKCRWLVIQLKRLADDATNANRHEPVEFNAKRHQTPEVREGWIMNALDARLLELVYPADDMRVAPDAQRQAHGIYWIDATFGRKKLKSRRPRSTRKTRAQQSASVPSETLRGLGTFWMYGQRVAPKVKYVIRQKGSGPLKVITGKADIEPQGLGLLLMHAMSGAMPGRDALVLELADGRLWHCVIIDGYGRLANRAGISPPASRP